MIRRVSEAFFAFPEHLDRWLRWRDLRFHRIDGTWLHRLGMLRGYSQLAFWLPVPIFFLLVWGIPLRWRGLAPVVALLIVVLIHGLVCRLLGRRGLVLGIWMLILTVGIGGWWLIDGGSREADPRPYRHVMQWLGPWVATLAIPANHWWANRILGGSRRPARALFASNLAGTQLFVRRQSVRRSPTRVLRAFSMVVLSSPWLLALLVALVTLAAPWQLLGSAFFGGVLLFVVLLGAAHFNPRLSTFREQARQAFFVGGPRFVSLAVMILAATRLVGIDYVTTLMDHWQTRLVVGFWILAWYALFWLYDYWTQRAAAEVLLSMLDSRVEVESHPTVVPYRNDCQLALHGAGRFLALTPSDDPLQPRRFQAYRPRQVFRRIHEQLVAKARVESSRDKRAYRWAVAHQAESLLRDIDQRLRIFYAVPALLLAGAMVGLFCAHDFGVQEPMVPPPSAAAVQPADFDLIERWRQLGTEVAPESPVLMISASGGGTRAALFTYAGLRSLAQHRALDRVFVLSGVSGGSAGLAHFAAHRDALCFEDPAGGNAWPAFRAAMAAPYIRDVVAGVGEWRGVEGIRFGHLLAEGLDRRYAPSARRTLNDAGAGFCGDEAAPIGLLFNTALAGRAPWRNGKAPRPEQGSSRDAGGRMVVTNVRGLGASPPPGSVGWTHGLPMRSEERRGGKEC